MPSLNTGNKYDVMTDVLSGVEIDKVMSDKVSQ